MSKKFFLLFNKLILGENHISTKNSAIKLIQIHISYFIISSFLRNENILSQKKEEKSLISL